MSDDLLAAIQKSNDRNWLIGCRDHNRSLGNREVVDAVEQRLRDMDLPPFAVGMGATARGGHEWQVVTRGDDRAYVGRSAAPEVAASFLLRLPAQGRSDAAPAALAHDDAIEIWVQREGAPQWPERLDDAALARQGWREVVVRYDAGVTRRDAAH